MGSVELWFHMHAGLKKWHMVEVAQGACRILTPNQIELIDLLRFSC